MTARPLLDDLVRRAAEEQDSARRAAGAEADHIRADARASANRRATEARATHTRETARHLALASAEGSQRASRLLLPERASALERIFARAATRIELRATHPGIGAALAPMVGDALQYLPDGAARARCAPWLAATVRRALDIAGHPGVQMTDDASVPLGAIVESTDGHVSVDATFVRRLQHDRPVLAAEVAARLGGAGQ